MSELKALLSGAPYVARAALVLGHAPDLRIRYRSEEAERTFLPVLTAQAISTNTADVEPHEAPRLLLSQGNKLVSLSVDRAQLLMTFGRSDLKIEQAYQAARKNARLFAEGVAKFQEKTAAPATGFVVEINLPSDAPDSELAKVVSDHLYKGPIIGEMSSLQILAGFKDDNLLFNTIHIYGYELRSASGTFTSAPPSVFNVSHLPVHERGLAVKFDVNNRPRQDSPDTYIGDDFDPIEDAMQKLLWHHFQKFLGMTL
jgi:hypothetical protein